MRHANPKIKRVAGGSDCRADNLVSFIWDVADLLRGPYRPPEYRKVMLPMTVLRRLDCIFEPSKSKVLEEQKRLKGHPPEYTHKMLQRAAKQKFYNNDQAVKFMENPELRSFITRLIRNQVYDRIQAEMKGRPSLTFDISVIPNFAV